MIGFLFFLFGLLVTVGMCGLAAWSDFKGFRIPNLVSIVIIAAFALAYGVTTMTGQRAEVFLSLPSHLAGGGIVMLVTMIMFAFKGIGAGDSKFATAVGLWVALTGLPPFLVFMTVSGGVIAITSLVLRRWKPLKNPPEGSWPAKAQAGHNEVPYGIAIAVGALIAFIMQGYFSLDKWASIVGS